MDNRKKQILNAARHLFNRQGYNKTSVDNIAQAVGMTKSSLYYYYKNKEQMFFHAFSSEWEENVDRFQDIAQKKKDPYQRILSYVKETLRYYRRVVLKHNIPVKVLIDNRNMFRDFINRLIEKRIEFISSNLDQGIKTGLFRSCDTKQIAKSILDVKYSMQYDRLTQYIHEEPNENQFKVIENDTIFAIELMLQGILKK